MAQTCTLRKCSLCGDRFQPRDEECCGRCQRVVCRACSRLRGMHHVSAVCRECDGKAPPVGVQSTYAFRAWRRIVSG